MQGVKSKTAEVIPKGKRLWEKHGARLYVPADWKDFHVLLYKFGTSEGEVKLNWIRLLIGELWPDPVFIFDRWSELFFGALCGAGETIERITGKPVVADFPWHRNVIFSGAAATGKSARAAIWVLLNWLCAQEHTACVLTSTSVDMLSRRIWSDILSWIASATVEFPLRSIPSDLELRWNDSDRKHAVFGVAVKSGGTASEACDRLKGIHAPRIFCVVDEMTSVPQAIVTACRNLNKGTKEFGLIGLGNAISKTDPHGERSEPRDGWNSVSVEDKFWITKYGCAVHLDAFDSPAMEDPVRFHFYPNKQALEEEAREKGGMNSPEAWSTMRGFWPPSGLSTTVMDDALLAQFNTSARAVWKRGWQMGGAFDPAFEGGDRRVLYPFRWGEFANGITGIEYQPPIIVAVDMTQDKRWIHYQIADAVQSLCEGYKIDGVAAPILPENFIADVSGEGGGLFSIMSGRWSPAIRPCEFGGAADKTQISPDRPTTWHELYGNRVTALWYALRRFIEGDQVRGLTDEETRHELTSRDKFMRNGKTVVVPKKDMKLTKARSPDKADAAVIGAEFLRLRGVMPAGTTGGGEVLNAEAWNQWANRVNLIDEDRDYASENSAFA